MRLLLLALSLLAACGPGFELDDAELLEQRILCGVETGPRVDGGTVLVVEHFR